MSLNPERIAEIRAAEQAATPGPWKFLPDYCRVKGGLYVIRLDMCVFDADFCILAREAVPELLAEIERLQEQRDECRADYKREVDNLRGWIAQLEAALTHATAKEEHFEIQAVAAANLRAREAKHG